MKPCVLKTVLSVLLFSVFSQSFKGQTWSWAKSGIGTGLDEGDGICADAAGNIYITGTFSSSTLVFGSNTLTSPGPSLSAVYLTKYDPLGNVIWARQSNGPGEGFAVNADAAGNIYLTGYLSGPSVSFGTYTLNNSGTECVFLTKYDSNGNVLWAKNSIGSGGDYSYSVRTDASGNAFICGLYTSSVIAFGAFSLTNSGTEDAFIAKYDATGNVLWAKSSVGGGSDDAGYGVGTDANGNAYMTGSFNSSTFSIGSYSLTNSGSDDVFITKLDANGNVLWLKGGIGSNIDGGNDLVTDPAGNSYVTGSFYSGTIAFSSFTLTNTYPGGGAAFLVKYDANGNVLWAKNSNGNAYGFSVSSNTTNVYISGGFTGSISFGAFTISPPPVSADPLFIVNYDINGNETMALALGSGGDDKSGICIDRNQCNAYITGDFIPASFAVGTNTLTHTGNESVFVAKLTFSCQSVIEGISQNNLPSDKFIISPVPNDGNFRVQIEEMENTVLTIFNSLGERSYEQIIYKGKNDLQVRGLARGIYYVMLTQNGITVSTKRIISE